MIKFCIAHLGHLEAHKDLPFPQVLLDPWDLLDQPVQGFLGFQDCSSSSLKSRNSDLDVVSSTAEIRKEAYREAQVFLSFLEVQVAQLVP